MAIPTAVAPTVLTPGFFLVVDLLAGAASNATQPLRVAILAPGTGDLTDDTEVRPGGGVASARTAYGVGTTGAIAAELLYQEEGTAQVDFAAPVAGTGTATLNITFGGAVAANNAALLDIQGREFEIGWLVGDTPDDMKTKTINAVNSRNTTLSCVAADGGVGVVTLNGKVTGNISNDILVQATIRDGQTGSETLVGAATSTPLVGGATDPDFANVLASISGKEYHIILMVLSNADVENVTGNLQDAQTHIETLNTGKDAKLQQFVVGYSGSIASGVTSAVARNAEVGEMLLCINGRGLPGELGGLETGNRIHGEGLDPAVNRIGNRLNGYIGAKDKIADKPTLPESEQALGGGVSLVDYNASDQEVLLRAITMHSQDSSGGADRRLLDVQNVSATYIVARSLRTSIPAEFPNAKIQADQEEGENPPPEGVIEERDIKAFLISELRGFQDVGVVTQASLDEAISNGTLIVRVNPSDPTQVDLVIPFSIIQPLAKFGVVVQRVPN